MTLCTERIRTLDDIRAFLDGNVAADITPRDRKSAYAFVERTLVRFRYHIGLSRAGKGLVRAFLAKVTGYSDAPADPADRAATAHGPHIRDHRLRPPSRPFAMVYTTADALLLVEVDEALGQLSGPATKRALWRMHHVFGDKRFERLAEISNGHIYNLRGAPGVPEREDHVSDDPGGAVADRAAAQTPAGGPTGLRTRRHRPQR